jgi:hypothetical protein
MLGLCLQASQQVEKVNLESHLRPHQSRGSIDQERRFLGDCVVNFLYSENPGFATL